MMNQNIITLNNGQVMSMADIQALLAAQGIKANIIVEEPKIKKYGKLQITDSKDTAYCLGCDREFSLSEIDNDEKLDFARKNGLCPECMKKVLEARAIMKKVKAFFNAEEIDMSIKSVSAKTLILEMLDMKKMNKTIMNKLTDREFCKKEMGLNNELFRIYDDKKDIDEQIKVNGYVKYSKKIYKFAKKSYIMTSDIYHRNIEKVKQIIKELGILKAAE